MSFITPYRAMLSTGHLRDIYYKAQHCDMWLKSHIRKWINSLSQIPKIP